MSSKEQYYTTGSVGKRRSSPGETNSVFFQGQGGRTVLPPISSAFPTSRLPVSSTYNTQYTQPRSSPSRIIMNQTAYYNQWATGHNSPPLPEPSFVPNYEAQDRYGTQTSYSTYPSARSSPPILQGPTDSRRLPPLSTTSAAGGDRWQQSSYQISPGYATANIRSPTASYPTSYTSYSNGGAYTYLPADQLDIHTGLFDLEAQVRSSSPSPYRTQLVDSSFTPPAPPISPATTTEEPAIKKKRKRADADQLKVLNEVYARTAFPSTEERNALAKQLGMSPRSVQIWFQNKRQSMRQTNRQSTTASSHCQAPYSGTPPATTHASRGLGPIGSPSDPTYITPSQDQARSHQSSSPHHHLPGQDDSMGPSKWPSRGF